MRDVIRGIWRVEEPQEPHIEVVDVVVTSGGRSFGRGARAEDIPLAADLLHDHAFGHRVAGVPPHQAEVAELAVAGADGQRWVEVERILTRALNEGDVPDTVDARHVWIPPTFGRGQLLYRRVTHHVDSVQDVSTYCCGVDQYTIAAEGSPIADQQTEGADRVVVDDMAGMVAHHNPAPLPEDLAYLLQPTRSVI